MTVAYEPRELKFNIMSNESRAGSVSPPPVLEAENSPFGAVQFRSTWCVSFSRTKFTYFYISLSPKQFSIEVNKGRTHEELWTIYYSEKFKRISEMGDFNFKKQETRNYCNKDRSDFKSG